MSEVSPSSTIAQAELIERYAAAVLRQALSLRRDDLVFVYAEPGHSEFIHALAAAAYKLGAEYVEVIYQDSFVDAARVLFAREQSLSFVPPWVLRRLRAQVGPRAAVVLVTGEDHLDPYRAVPRDRAARAEAQVARSGAWYRRAHRAFQVRWCIAPWPGRAWAARVYGANDVRAAQSRLARDVFHFSYIDDESPSGEPALAAHLRVLRARATRLTRMQLERLELRGRGTELDLSLAPGTVFVGGSIENPYGQRVVPNIPTEEVFTSPKASASSGFFRCTRPIVLGGELVHGVNGEFRRGRLVRIAASDERQRDLLAATLSHDRDAGRVGEIGLVDRSSRIGQADRAFFSPLIDENATTHLGMGAGFAITRMKGSTGARTVNRSLVHLDLAIGDDDLLIVGVKGRRRHPVLENGQWVI